MQHTKVRAIFTVQFVMLAYYASAAKFTLVDLSYSYSNKTLYFPNNQKYIYTKKVETVNENISYNFGEFCTSEHGGTHSDAPSHFVSGKKSIDQIPLENLHGPAVVIDIKEKAALDRNACVTVEDLLNWEQSHGIIPKGSIVLMNSGWGKKATNEAEFFGIDKEGSFEFHYPGFCPQATEFLLRNRSINAIGVDSPSIDIARDKTFPSHFLMANANKIGLENVANLDQVPAAGAYIYALPMKLEGGTGGPTRVIAILGKYY